MSATASSVQPSTNAPVAGRLFVAGLTGGAIAAVANLVVYFGAHAAGVDFMGKFDPSQPAQGLMVPMVAVSSLVPGLFAALLGLGLKKLTAAAPMVFLVITVAFALLSMGGPANIAEASMGTKAALGVMHLVAAAGIGGLVYRALKAA